MGASLLSAAPIDLACIGIGENGHIAFQDPPAACSLTCPAIMSADRISVVCPDARKAAAVKGALSGPISTKCPASILRRHNDVHFFLDQASAAQWREDS